MILLTVEIIINMDEYYSLIYKYINYMSIIIISYYIKYG